MEREIDEQLKTVYSQWLDELKMVAPQFLSENRYSNPYFTCVPKGWCDSQVRILIVGEEGHGVWGRGKSEGVRAGDIQKIQEFCWCSLVSYLGYEPDYDLYPIQDKYEKLVTPFWNRASKLYEYGICAWTNLDSIHILGDHCELPDEDKVKLHSTKTKLLSEEIRLLKPTHVVFAGWYGISLKEELPELYMELYPNGSKDESVWKKKVVYRQMDGVHYICAYHPAWGVRQKGYEDEVLKVFQNTLE